MAAAAARGAHRPRRGDALIGAGIGLDLGLGLGLGVGLELRGGDVTAPVVVIDADAVATSLPESSPAASTTADPSRDRRTRRRPWRSALVLGLIASIVSGAFAWVPSLWYDEGASVTAATRDVEALGVLVRQVDAVHALYYWLLHQWFELVGYSAFALRVPSIVAAGVTVTVTVLLVERLASRRLALITGVVLLVLPRFTWAGGEGRSYALSLLLVTLASLLLVCALQYRGDASPRRRRLYWVAYAVVTGLSIVLYLYVALALVAHAAVVAVLLIARRLRWREAVPFAITAAAAVLSTWPLTVLAERQKGQVSWIHPLDATTPHAVLVTQYFPKAAPFALVAWLMIALGGALLVRGFARRPLLATLTIALLTVPTLGLLAASVALTPLYSPRYLTFCLPAVAIAMAVVVDALPRRALRIVGVALIVALAVPSYVGQRMPEAKQHSDWNQVADHLAARTAELGLIETGSGAPGAAPSTTAGIVWGGLRGHPTVTSRVIAQSYPQAVAGLGDVNASSPPRGLWERNTALDPALLSGYDDVWYVVSNHSETQDEKFAVFRDAGFELRETTRFSRTDVYLFERG
ncbi:mannosyltransferase [Schumannella luteola]|uniref:Mannosyltransferase n=1 Tax=Schumannella luteola TaxID=472059 RepID=A0A852YMY5_9MICO|nr:mannosyltransferase [Schumannella luteola]